MNEKVKEIHLIVKKSSMRFSFFVKKHQNLSIFILIILLAVFFSGSFLIFEFQKFEKDILLAKISFFLNKPSQEVTLLFVGDIMLDRGVEWSINKYGAKNWKFPFLKVAKDLEKADILFGNLESVISDKGTKVGSIYSFRADPKAIEGLIFAGFDVVSVANNHIFDYSQAAMEDSFKRLKEAGIDYVGGGFNEEEAQSPVIKEINGSTGSPRAKARIAFLAYNGLGSRHWEAKEDRSGIAWLEEEKLVEDVKKAKEQADLVIVSMHFGDEYQMQSNSSQKLMARLAIDAGADLIIGHHPHVVQEIEEYPTVRSAHCNSCAINKGKYIAYSLGNFVFDQAFSEETMQGLMLKVVIESGKIKEVIPIDIKINEFFQPEIAEE